MIMSMTRHIYSMINKNFFLILILSVDKNALPVFNVDVDDIEEGKKNDVERITNRQDHINK